MIIPSFRFVIIRVLFFFDGLTYLTYLFFVSKFDSKKFIQIRSRNLRNFIRKISTLCGNIVLKPGSGSMNFCPKFNRTRVTRPMQASMRQ